ncbi:TRAP transporter small permease [Neobacillus sp. GCM10023253]|uniref:TRAP transporter small permease n=1 Tax=Neobacillus sp. GCM10023253 TaxID=3252644 RepID=UPI00361BDBD0
MMLLITADALARYIFHQSIPAVYNITESYLMVLVVFLGMAYAHYKDDHIKFELIINLMPRGVQKILHVVTHFFALVFFAAIGYEGLLLTEDAWLNNASSGGIVSIPMYLSYIWVPLGSFMLVFISVLKIAESSRMEFPKDNNFKA